MSRILPLALALALCASPARAGFIDFNPTPDAASTAVITFGADGSLSGSIPIASLTGVDTPLNAGHTIPIANGLLTFSFPNPIPFPGGYNFKSGTVAITGTLQGQTIPQTLFSMAIAPAFLSVLAGHNLFADPVLALDPTVPPDVLAPFGANSSIGYLYLDFAGAPGSPATLLSALVRSQSATGVPEPASGLLAALGFAFAIARHRMRHRMA
jgi:hypothetical protein